MSGITDELRDCIRTANRSYEDVRNPHNDREILHIPEEELLAIADRIDAEHDQMHDFCERLESAVTDREDVTLWGVDYIALPLDADGEAIHVGDVMESKGSDFLFGEASFEVRAMRHDEGGWEVYDRLGDRYAPSLLRHHHAPTVEDVLREFALRAIRDSEANMGDLDETCAEYASKLMLKEDA